MGTEHSDRGKFRDRSIFHDPFRFARLLKPLMTIEVPDSDFGTDVGADVAQQKYQDSVHDFFSMDKEDMDLRPSLSSRNLFTAPRTPRTDDRVSNNTREEIADNNDREAKTKEYIIGKRRTKTFPGSWKSWRLHFPIFPRLWKIGKLRFPIFPGQ